jgi:tetratricopeptide (TPR) repeat protein
MTNLIEIMQKAETLSEMEEHEAAEDLLRDALLQEPADQDLKTLLAIILTRRAYDDEAEKLLRDVLSENPTHERAVSALGHLLDSCLRTEEAENLYLTALAQLPQSHTIIDDLSRLLLDENRFDEALELSRQHAFDYQSEYHAYDAVRFVLQSLEDNYLFDMEESDYSRESCEILLLNLLEQFETIIALESSVGVESLKEMKLYEDIMEESVRVFCEIESLNDKLKTLGCKTKSDITKRTESALKIGRSRHNT